MAICDSIVRAQSFQVYAEAMVRNANELTKLIDRIRSVTRQITGLETARGMTVNVDSAIRSCDKFDVVIHRHELSDELKDAILKKLNRDLKQFESDLLRKLSAAEAESSASSDAGVFNELLDFLGENNISLSSRNGECILSRGEHEVQFKIRGGSLNTLVERYFKPAINRLQNFVTV